MKNSFDALSPVDLRPNYNNSYVSNEAYYNYGASDMAYNMPFKKIAPVASSAPRAHKVGIRSQDGDKEQDLAAVHNPPWALSAEDYAAADLSKE